MKELSLEVLQYLSTHQLLAFGFGATVGILLLLFLIPPVFYLCEKFLDIISKTYKKFSPATDSGPHFDEQTFFYRDAYSERQQSSYGYRNSFDESYSGYERNGSSGSEREEPSKEFDPFQVLGLKSDASKEEIRKAYKEAVKLYHPDKYQSLPPKLKESSTEITKALNAAYRVLKERGMIE